MAPLLTYFSLSSASIFCGAFNDVVFLQAEEHMDMTLVHTKFKVIFSFTV